MTKGHFSSVVGDERLSKDNDKKRAQDHDEDKTGQISMEASEASYVIFIMGNMKRTCGGPRGSSLGFILFRNAAQGSLTDFHFSFTVQLACNSRIISSQLFRSNSLHPCPGEVTSYRC